MGRERKDALPKTVQINRKTSETICHAFDYAKHIDRPLNLYVVMRMNEVDNHACEATFRAIRRKCRVWLQRKQQLAGLPMEPPYYVYSFENPEDTGVHLNWVLHIPDALVGEFRKKITGWVAKAQGFDPEGDDIHIQDVDPHTDKSLAKYIIKGTDPHYAKYLHLQHVVAPQGTVHGRRASACNALNRAARRKAGFIPKRDRNAWKNREWAATQAHPVGSARLWEAVPEHA